MSSMVELLARHDFGTWSQADIERLLATAGLTIEDDEWGAGAKAWDGWELRLSRRQAHDEDNGYSDFTAVRAVRKVPAGSVPRAHRDLMAAATDTLGKPAVVGGPGAWATWRDANTTTLTVSQRIHREDGWLTIAVVPTEAYETEVYRNAEYNPDWRPESRWEIRPEPGSLADQKLLGMMGWPHPNATTWDKLTANVTELFGSLNQDLPILHPLASCLVWTVSVHNGPWIAQGWFSHQESQLEIPGEQLVLRVGEFDPATGEVFAQKTIAALKHAAETPKALRYTGFATVKPQEVNMIGFGVPHEADAHPDFRDDDL